MPFQKKRLLFAKIIFFLVFLGVAYRLVDLQILQGEDYKQSALDNRLREVTVESKRGNIYDRNKKLLATSTQGESVAAFPAEIREGKYEPQQIASALAPILEVEEESLIKKIESDHTFVWLKRKIDFSSGPAIEKLDLPGIELYQESQRYYPKGRLASQTIGFAGIDNQGLEGLEATYDEILLGQPGRVTIEMDRHNREIPQSVHSYQPPTMGQSLVTTIDERLQYITEKKAAELYLDSGAQGVEVIVMDIKNGEILSMTNIPDFEPAAYGDYPSTSWKNSSLQNIYEPGSTFKIISAAAFLELGIAQPTDNFTCRGYEEIGKHKVRCWRAHPHGKETFAEAFANSCNPVFAQVAVASQEKDLDQLYDFYQKLGFGQKTEVVFTGQARGIMPEAKRPINQATSAIGQGIAVSPIQLASAIASLVGDGRKIEPVLVSAILDEEGNIVERFTGRKQERILSRESVSALREMLELACLEGTAKTGQIPGYRVGAKTGTAQKPSPDGGYEKDKFITSFVSIAPIEDPEVLSLVIVDSPVDQDASGSKTAGPTSAFLLEEALSFKNIKPALDLEKGPGQESAEQTGPAAEVGKKDQEVIMPDLEGSPLSSAVKTLEALGLEVSYTGLGSRVSGQSVPAGKALKLGQSVSLELKEDTLRKDQRQVPDLVGLRIFQALEKLDEKNLYLQIEGQGTIQAQEPAPGSIVKEKTTIRVVCGKD